ncbi:NAD(P)/FAD-dependent oxidoreductase, partial [Castellaniella sp.]
TTDIIAQYVFNCAGLSASAVAACMDGMPDACIPTIRYAKGNYYGYSGRNPFSRLIYPVPEPAGLGVHLTLDLNRQIRFGPDVEWIDTVDYTVAPGRARQFYGSIRRYWPGLPDGALRPDYAGIRPKIQAPAGTETDFLIQGIETHGIPGLVHLYGIESPGLTASLAIAEHALAVAGIRP